MGASALIVFFIISDFMQIDSRQLIPSHASNGEVEFIVHMKDDIESIVMLQANIFLTLLR
jgi:hypothetical protein